MKNELRIQNKRRDRPLSKDISQLAEFINLTVKDLVITHGLYIVDDDGHVAHALLPGWERDETTVDIMRFSAIAVSVVSNIVPLFV